MNTKTITTGFVALLMILMALAPTTMNVNDLNETDSTEWTGENGTNGTLYEYLDTWAKDDVYEIAAADEMFVQYYAGDLVENITYGIYWEVWEHGGNMSNDTLAGSGDFNWTTDNTTLNKSSGFSTGPGYNTGCYYIMVSLVDNDDMYSFETEFWDFQVFSGTPLDCEGSGGGDDWEYVEIWVENGSVESGEALKVNLEMFNRNSSMGDLSYEVKLLVWSDDNLSYTASAGSGGSDGAPWEYNLAIADGCYYLEAELWIVDEFGAEVEYLGLSNGFEFVVGSADCFGGGDDECPFNNVTGSPCEPVATNPCYYDDPESSECYDYVMEYCATHSDDPGCDDMGEGDDCPFENVTGSPCEPVATNPCFADHDSDECMEYAMEYCATHDDPACDMGGDGPTFICGNGEEIPFDYVNDDWEDCDDGSDEQQYDSDGDPENWFDCSDGSEIWIYEVNDGYDDCPYGEDEMGDDDGGDDMDCDQMYIEFHLVTSALGGVNFVFDMICEMSVEQSDAYREMIDLYAGNGDGEINAAEVAAFMEMMLTCHDEDGDEVECDNSCYDDDGTEIDCDEDAEGEQWSINGVVMEMYQTEMEWNLESILGDGGIETVNGMSSGHVDLADGEDEVTVTFVNNNDGDDEDDDECFQVQVLTSGDWSPTSVSVEPAEDWEIGDIDAGSGYLFYGCSSPDTFTAVFSYTGDGHPNGVENLPPICEFKWFIATDTEFEDGHLVTEGPDGDVEIELGAGSYMISVWCMDAEMDYITVTWEASSLNISKTMTGDGEVNGWVMFIVPPGISEKIVVPYSWTSEEWSGSGDFIITLDSGEGDGDDVEGSGGGLPGFTSLMTVTALLGAVFFLGRRD